MAQGAVLIDPLSPVCHDQGNQSTGPGDHSERQFHQVENVLGVSRRSGLRP